MVFGPDFGHRGLGRVGHVEGPRGVAEPETGAVIHTNPGRVRQRRVHL